MKLDKLFKYIDPEKLPWDYRELCDIVGLEQTLAVAARVGGTHMYMEKIDTILMPFIRAYVLDEFNQARHKKEKLNVREVARDMNVSQETVYDILRHRHDPDTEKPGWKQEVLI